jgi:hypothetical protein
MIWRVIAIGLLTITLAILLPFFKEVDLSSFAGLISNTSFISTLQTTVFNAFFSAIALVVFGFVTAVLLLRIPPYSFIGKNLGLLIIPVTLGNISIAFMSKLLLGDTSFFSRLAQGSPFSKLGFLLLIELYQFGLLFAYMFWMQLKSISTERTNYALATRFSFYQKLKDIYLPQTRNLWLLLSAIGFVFAFYEESKMAYLFKVSQGTGSELITNWLTRTYQTNLLANPEFAKTMIFDASTLVMLSAIAGLIFTFTLLYTAIKNGTSIRYYPSIFKLAGIRKLTFRPLLLLGFLLPLAAVSPILLTLTKVNFGLEVLHLAFPLLMTFVATSIASFTAILFGIASRLGWKQTLHAFNQKSLPFFVLLFMLLLVPPIVILITGFQWMSWIGYSSQTIIYSIWVIGHVLLTLPVLGSFVLFNHFRVSNNELDYLQVHQLNKWEAINFSFLKRFRAEYLLLFIIGFSFVWNEAVLNNLFSDYIPSFVAGMKMLITGRGADYNKAFGYLLISFLIALLSAALWRYIIEKASKQMKNNL